MMWRRFIVSVCFVIAVHSAFGCSWGLPPMDGLYMFKSYHWTYDASSWDSYYGYYEADDEKQAARDANVTFWYNYTKGHVDRLTIYRALYKLPLSDIDNGTNRFFSYLKEQNDEEALNYWRMSKGFSEKSTDPWFYPTLKDKVELLETAQFLRAACQQGDKPELHERYLLQMMRITFYLKEYPLCIQLWKEAPTSFKDADIQKKFTNYYAGALLHVGEKAAAANLYGNTGDWTSLNYLPNDITFMQDLYTDYPSSRAFEYLVQHFVNQYQEYPKANRKAAFTDLANKALKDQKTDDPALWQSALAHIAFLDGDIATAVTLIEKAAKMKGTPVVMENVRMLSLLYHAADGKASDYDAKIAADLPWLIQKVHNLTDAERWVGCDMECHDVNILRIIVFKYLEPHYSSIGNTNMAIAILNAYDEASYLFDFYREEIEQCRENVPDSYSNEYRTYSFSYLDTTTIAHAKDFLAFVKSGGKSQLEKKLIQMGYVCESYMNELIGTKYMRTGDYKNAIVYLQKVNSNFYKTQNIYQYLTANPFSEYWIARQGERKQCGTANPAKSYAANPSKLQFCQIMSELEQQIAESSDPEEKAQLLYALSVGKVQQSDNNVTWALTHYIKGYTWTMYDACYRYGLHEAGEMWDYQQSLSPQIQATYKNLLEAERMTQNPELVARCQYLRSYIETDGSIIAKIRHEINSNTANTNFYRNEIRHCDLLSDYRNNNKNSY